MKYEFHSLSVDNTQDFGFQLGKKLRGGDVLCLIGELGAGKTALAQGIGRALGVQDYISSPTFTIIHEYPVLVKGQESTLVHVDLYRLQHPEEAEIIGLADIMQRNTICLIEWPEIAVDLLPDDRLEIRINGNGNLPRIITVDTLMGEWAQRMQGL